MGKITYKLLAFVAFVGFVGFPSVAYAITNSDVQSIDQVTTTEAKSWTYTVDEPGNYQLGYAWIWVDGVDQAVDFVLKVGNDTIKTFTAKSAIAPYRFETRLENLTQGEVISVSAIPKGGASYRLSYHLAYATPTFTGLLSYDVANYGAVGDSIANDYQAVQDACNAAKDAGGGIVTFDGSKTYYVKGPENYALFNFINTANIKVEGNGAKIILHPLGNFVRMDSSENIQIDGLTTTYSPLPYFQGDIVAMNVAGLYLDMQVDARYDAPLLGKYVQQSNIFGRSFWVTVPSTKMGDGRHLSIDSTAQIGGDDHAIRVFLQSNETNDLQSSKDNNASKFVVPHKDYGHEGLKGLNIIRDSPYCNIKRSARVKISNITTHSVCHFAYTIGGNSGPITFSNTDILTPNEDDMHVTWRDGWHVWGNRYGIMIEDGDFDGGAMYDDIFSPHVNVPIVESASGKSVKLKSKPGENWEKYTTKSIWQVGDLVSFWDENQTVYYGMARITETNQGKWRSVIYLGLDTEITGAQAGAYAINEETINRDMVVRNCRSTPKGRTVAVRNRTPILYENCNFQNIHFWTYLGEPWRTRPRNIVFDNCIINERNTFNVDDAWNVTIKDCDIKEGLVDVSNCPRLSLDSNSFDGYTLKSNTRAFIFGNSRNRGGSDKDGSSTVLLQQPSDYPSFRPPFLMDDKSPIVMGVTPYVSDSFDDGTTALSGSSGGIGWSGAWLANQGTGIQVNTGSSLGYPSASLFTATGGYIYTNSGASSTSNKRLLTNSIILGNEGDTFYVSFLAQKSASGAIRIDGQRSSDGLSRFGLGIEADGKLTVQAAVETVTSSRSIFENDKTYLVVARWDYDGQADLKMILFEEGDLIPSTDVGLTWDHTDGAATGITGVVLEQFNIEFSAGAAMVDELKVGSSWSSVTIPTAPLSVNNIGDIKNLNIYPNPAKDHFVIQTAGLNLENARVEVLSLSGQTILVQQITTTQSTVEVNISSLTSGLYLVRLISNDSNFVAKLIVE